ncbi:MAG TPA: carbamate kinase [Thermoplasmata archaeon]|nr:carbamate kinase [Thermoplasmata archaeon]
MTRILVALGGNAIQRAHDAGTWAEATRQMRRTAPALAAIVARGHELIVTHGNGPQVGDLLREAELGAPEVPAPPMDVLGAESEGQIGYLIAQELGTALVRARAARAVVPVISRTEVSSRDPAFRRPTKPVGRFYSKAEAGRLQRREGWTLREDPRRGGWRRVVPSPRPVRWLEAEAIRAALDAGLGRRCVFVVAGGGGIPVVRGPRGSFRGVEAVIDKDRGAAVVARQLGAWTLAIVTDVPGAATGFGTPRERWLGRVSADKLRADLAAGEFAEGSMGPKIAAGLEFLDAGGRYLVITDITSLARGLAGTAGTRVGTPV